MDKYRVIGVMSGTSLDGLDLACCNFELIRNKWKYNIQEAETIPYDSGVVHFLASAYNSSASELIEKDHVFGNYIGKKVIEFIQKHNLKVDLVASHGHTIFHQPEKGYSFQLGNGTNITSVSKNTTISDFRSMDIANGGQGAPLVPVGDDLLFPEYDFCLNLGGFSNISFREDNIFLNKFAGYVGKTFDKDGIIASQGEIKHVLLDDLNNIDYYRQSFPKSLGREWFEEEFLSVVEKYDFRIQDLLRTGSEHIAIQIGEVLKKHKQGKVLITGGGAFNKFLMKLISEKTNIHIVIPDQNLVNFKEAMIFAFLGVLKYRNEINCYSSVTGAKQDSSCGVIYTYIG